MEVTKKYEANVGKAYADKEHGQVISRSLFAVVERGDMPLDSGFSEAEIIEVESPTAAEADGQDKTLRIRIDSVPQDTIATDPDAAASAAAVMQGLSHAAS